jgi:hypothetical protein
VNGLRRATEGYLVAIARRCKRRYRLRSTAWGKASSEEGGVREVHRVRVLAGVVIVLAGALAAGVLASGAGAGSPSAEGTRQLVDPPAALQCGGAVKVKVDLTGTAGVEGTATDIVLVFDLSGSVGSFPQTAKNEAKEFVESLGAQDGGLPNELGLGNSVGIVKYRSTAVAVTAPTTDVGAVVGAIDSLSTSGTGSDGSDHAEAIALADLTLGPQGTHARTIIVFSDGEAGTDGSGAADTARGDKIKVVTVGVGSPINSSELRDWTGGDLNQPLTLNAGTEAGLLGIVGAAKSTPAEFELTETLGANFTASVVSPPPGVTVEDNGKTVKARGSLGTGETAEIVYTATRNGSDLFSVTEEVVSSGTLTVDGSPQTLTPASLMIDVLPCDAEELLDSVKDCTGSGCGAEGANGGVAYSVSPGNVGTSTDLFVSSLENAPPLLPNGKSVCPGFDVNTNGVQFDIRPLTTAGMFEITIPKAALGTKKWWQTDVCVGTNLRFITKIGSLANLRPGATKTTDRWWGLLPSVKRYTLVGGKLVAGPWINKRSVDSSGNAKIQFTMPYVTGSEPYTTNGQAAFDPRVWGG